MSLLGKLLRERESDPKRQCISQGLVAMTSEVLTGAGSGLTSGLANPAALINAEISRPL